MPRKLPVLPINARTFMLPSSIDYRLECARYDECLDVAAKRPEYHVGARCPVECRWHEAPKVESAVDYAVSGRSNYEAAVYAGG